MPDSTSKPPRDRYDGTAETWREVYRSAIPYGRKIQRRRDAVVAAVERRLTGRTARILDAGCGTGEVTRRLAALGNSVVGLELSPEMLAEAIRETPPGKAWPTYVRGSVGAPPFGSASFDAVVLVGILGHVLRRRTGGELFDAESRVLRGLVGVLRPGGFMVMDFQNALRLHWLLDPVQLRSAIKVRRAFDLQEREAEVPDGVHEDPARLWSTAPLWHRTPGEFRRTLEALGLRIVDWSAFERAARTAPWHMLDRLCSTPVLTVERAGTS
jgi:SAM-dependent methyltransferase